MKQPNKNISFMQDVVDQQTIDENKESPYHLHQKGKGGASGVGKGRLLRALKASGFKLPKVTGRRAWKGALVIGHDFHEIQQDRLKRRYAFHPALEFFPEGFIEQKICDGYTAVSPVDEIMFKREKGNIEEREYQFKTMTAKIPFINNFENIEQIGDIKTAGDWAFWHKMNHGLGKDYLAQGHVYLKSCNQAAMPFRVINKETNQMFVIWIEWDQAIWDWTVENTESYVELLNKLCKYVEVYVTLGKELPPAEQTEETLFKTNDFMDYLEAEDCCCLADRDGIDWWSCPLCPTESTIDKLGKESVKRVGLCKFAEHFLYKKPEKYFQKGTLYKSGRYKYYFDRFDADKDGQICIFLTEKARKEKKVSLLDAFLSYKEVKDESWPEHQSKPEFPNYDPIGSCSRCNNYVNDRCTVFDKPISEIDQTQICEEYI